MKLKKAGFPQGFSKKARKMSSDGKFSSSKDVCLLPTLSELIEACGVDIKLLCGKEKSWATCRHFDMDFIDFEGSTPEEAVAHLYLALNKKK